MPMIPAMARLGQHGLLWRGDVVYGARGGNGIRGHVLYISWLTASVGWLTMIVRMSARRTSGK